MIRLCNDLVALWLQWWMNFKNKVLHTSVPTTWILAVRQELYNTTETEINFLLNYQLTAMPIRKINYDNTNNLLGSNGWNSFCIINFKVTSVSFTTPHSL